LVVAEANSQLSLIESFHVIGEGDSFNNALTEIYCDQHSYVDYTKYQIDCDTLQHVGTTQAYQESESHFSATTVTWSGKLIRNNVNAIHGGEHCETIYNGFYYVDGNRHVDNHTVVDHAQPNCTSTENYKGMATDSGTAVFNGKIKVHQDAQKTSAFQSNKNILLSGKATINAKPELEIYADDVKCSHGATTGQLNPEEIFYLQARGISKENAKKLLLLAFARDILGKVRIIPLNKHLNDLFEQKLIG
jgi:Fe-S cluster assembly protein SufD